ncbi:MULTISPECIES: hypothetical protein [unclassified Moraxella]|uniref:hypothetical protein n=1 Tax=unclassified Moraxella TaxID=2685852 RepID=UPI003AF41C74
MIEMQEETIRHSVDEHGVIEQSTLIASVLDNDAFLQTLGFHNPLAFKKVDYIKTKGQTVFLIELTDLTTEIKNCLENQLILDAKPSELMTLLKSAGLNVKVFSKKLWFEVIEEFKGKFIGSMVCYERLLRLNADSGKVDYKLMIVLKNDTDPKDFEFLQINLNRKLRNITGEIQLLRTQDL